MNTIISRAPAVRFSSRRGFRSFLTIGFASLLSLVVASTRANAQQPDVEDPVVVPIQVTVDPGQSIPFFFTEAPDNLHTKHMQFDGVANTVPGAVGTLDIQFDWFDPNSGGFLLSPIFTLQVPGGAPVPFSFPFDIPFCPSEISLHLSNNPNAAGVPIQVDGTFTYQCVPEPSSIVLAAFGLIGLGIFGWRRKR